jgi:hypothetical protein
MRDDDDYDHQSSTQQPDRFDNNQSKVPTYQEYHKTRIWEKKWGNMMTQWPVPSQRLKIKHALQTSSSLMNM